MRVSVVDPAHAVPGVNEVQIYIRGGNFQPGLDVKVGTEGTPTWAYEFYEDSVDCGEIVGRLIIPDTAQLGDVVPIEIDNADGTFVVSPIQFEIRAQPLPIPMNVHRTDVR